MQSLDDNQPCPLADEYLSIRHVVWMIRAIPVAFCNWPLGRLRGVYRGSFTNLLQNAALHLDME